jgi:hypothetical protein
MQSTIVEQVLAAPHVHQEQLISKPINHTRAAQAEKYYGRHQSTNIEEEVQIYSMARAHDS